MKKGIIIILLMLIAPLNLNFMTEACEGYEPALYDSHIELTDGTSSYLIEKGKPKDLYLPRKAIDNDINTAWVEGKDGDGIGEFILIRLANMRPIKFIKLMPGYAKNEKLFFENNRPKELKIIIFQMDYKQIDVLKQENDIKKYKIVFQWNHELQDKRQFQQIDLPDYSKLLLKNPPIWMAIIIKSVYKGTKYTDTAIAEIRFIDEKGVDVVGEWDENWKFKHGVTK